MKISRELIEKYHKDTCSAEEREAVEEWLLNDDDGEDAAFPSNEDKSVLQSEIWDMIVNVVPEQNELPKTRHYTPIFSFWRSAAAALFIIAGLGAAYFTLSETSSVQSGVLVISNTSETANRNVDDRAYSLAIAPHSNVEINTGTGRIDFCGALMINPKRDMEFTIQGACLKNGVGSEKILLKKGMNYIALHYSSPAKSDEVVILNEQSMNSLPPLMMRQLAQQFNI